MAMPPSQYPQLTLFEVKEIHFDGNQLVLRNRDKEHLFTINFLTCYGVTPRLYQHEPRDPRTPVEPVEPPPPSSGDFDEPIPF